METLKAFPLSFDSVRKSGDYHPSVWGDYFLSYNPISANELASLKPRMDELKVEITQMFNNTKGSLQMMELIDAIQRLGIGYHFEKEINEALCHLFNTAYDENDLYTVALRFRLLRQQRYHISSDVFSKFLDEKGDFKDCFSSDAKALLSLYDAAHLGMATEEILDKAINFSKTHLISMKSQLEPHFSLMVSSSLEIPLFKRTDRIKTRNYLSIYEQDTKFNEALLEFGKFDFICLQAMHQEEARKLSMWWKNLGLSKRLPFSRDRLVECYFWVLSVYFEPYYSRARIIMTKCITQMSFLDDIYDVYGTVEELHLLTDAIEGWDIKLIDKLPEYMQHSFRSLFETFKEIEIELAPEQSSFRVQYLIYELKKVSKAYLQEAIWANKCYVPKLEEHFGASLLTAGYSFLTCASYMGMKEAISKEVFDWVISLPEIVMSSCVIGRLMNDIVSFEHERKRTHVASAVQSYAMEHGCSEEEACNKLTEMSNNAWKSINKEFVELSNLPLSLVWPIVNLARFNEFIYLGNDRYTNSSDHNMKQSINAVLVEPIQMEKVKD
ncbi:alpha-humulene synthase-like [Phalaenopsis equestris]|uniref:alpha-humulene synthase-like n=1 Tax=Phalaenopsis equestris TaxID=78828 RepID=UPI0009E3F6A0|nr:alpha-humulene synthase-like [Phalaenopsis equestris]